MLKFKTIIFFLTLSFPGKGKVAIKPKTEQGKSLQEEAIPTGLLGLHCIDSLTVELRKVKKKCGGHHNTGIDFLLLSVPVRRALCRRTAWEGMRKDQD